MYSDLYSEMETQELVMKTAVAKGYSVSQEGAH